MTSRRNDSELEEAAGGGLLSRRLFLSQATVAGSSLLLANPTIATAEYFDTAPPSWKSNGNGYSNYGTASDRQDHPIRWIANNPAAPGDGVSWTPHHQLQGTITPNGLHFERHHNGVPEIDPATWEVAVFGSVQNQRAFSLNDLLRLPMESRQLFIECGGNSNALWREQPVQTWAGYMHGLLSCAEWTGVRLSTLLDIAGVDSSASWLIADGLDSSGVSVSIPLDKANDDVLIALYQNGEPIRAEQGYPARLVVPGWEGITNVKWLHSLRLSDRPLMSKFDTVSYTDLQPDGSFERFSFTMGVKSFITQPSPGYGLQKQGVYEIRGLAWSGHGHITSVEVSADGGKSWAEAELQEPVMRHSLVRFRIPWNWKGEPAQLLSRAKDSEGNVQPGRRELVKNKGTSSYYHYNAMTTWSVNPSGDIRHIYL